MFWTVPLSVIRTFSLYTQQWYMSYRFADSLRAGSGQNQFRPDPAHKLSAKLWHIPLLCVQWKTPDDGQRNCLKHVKFYSKNKFEKFVHLVGFIVRIYDIIHIRGLASLWSCLGQQFLLFWCFCSCGFVNLLNFWLTNRDLLFLHDIVCISVLFPWFWLVIFLASWL